MSRVDTAWWHMDRPRNPADIVAMFVFDRGFDPDRIQRVVAERLLAHARFRQRIIEGPFSTGPRWETDGDFQLERHICRRELASTEPRALDHVVHELASEPLDIRHPPWRVVLASASDHAAVIVKLHHCLGDGFALVSLLLALSDEGVIERRAAPRWVPSSELALLRAPAALRAALGDPARALEAAREALEFTRSLSRMALLPHGASKVLARPLSGLRQLAWTRPIPLEGLLGAGRARGATVNELLMASLSGALRRSLAAAGEEVDGLALRALVPVNTRDDQAAALRALGNRFGLVFLDIPVGVASPAARLEAVHANAQLVRNSPDPLVTLAVLGALGLCPRPIERLGADFFSRKASLVVTNVPGPRRPLHLMGQRVDRILFWVPHPATLGLGVSLISYAGSVSIGVRADTAVLPDPGALATFVEAELSQFVRPARRVTSRRSRRAEARV